MIAGSALGVPEVLVQHGSHSGRVAAAERSTTQRTAGNTTNGVEGVHMDQREVDTIDLARVADARSSARWLRRISGAAATLGVLSFVVILAGYLLREVNAEQAIAAAFSTTFFTILSGATSYGAASNLDLNASRMERQVLQGGGAGPPTGGG